MREIANIARFVSSHPLTRDAPLSAWGRIIDWQIRSRMQREVIFPWISGQKLAVCRGMTGATGNVYAGLHEFVDMMLTLHFLRAGELFLDVGSNVGSYAVLASGVRRAETWAFEPDPGTVHYLRRNLELNSISNLVKVHELAVGHQDGEASFTRGLDTMNRIAADRETNIRRVQMRKLDTLTGASMPVMMKMDVEGFEENVLRGAHELLAKESLKVIAIESVPDSVQALFVRNGFARAYYDPFHRALTAQVNTLQSSNAIFVKDWPFVAARLREAPPVCVFGKWI